MRAMVPSESLSVSGRKGAISPFSIATAILMIDIRVIVELVAFETRVEIREVAQRQRGGLDDQIVEGDLGSFSSISLLTNSRNARASVMSTSDTT